MLPGVRKPTRSNSLGAGTGARSLPFFETTSGIFTSGCCGRAHGICEVGGVAVDAAAEDALAAFLAAFAASVDDWACSGVPSSRAIATAVEAIAWFLIACSSLLAGRNVLNGDDVDGAFFAVVILGDALVGDRRRDHVLRRGLFGEDVVGHSAVAELELVGDVRRVVPGNDGIRRHGLGIRRKRRRAVLPLDGDGKIGHGVLPLFLRIGAGRDTTPHSFNDSDRGLELCEAGLP